MMRCKLGKAIASHRFFILAFVLWACAPSIASAQTPSPLQEWQYSSGIILEKLQLYRTSGGPVINVRYKDTWFASVGEGFGVNVLHGDNYRAGVLLGYDLGRRVADDITHLHGLGDIGRAPVAKVFACYAVSKDFPLVLRGDVRQIVGGADGLLADLGAYIPLPGSSKKLIMFAGPSVTWADHRYMQREFGVTTTQSLASGYPIYEAHSGANAAGLGFTATRFLTEHWLINMDAAVDHQLGSARSSPITQRNVQRALALSAAYNW
jgi:outer membrane scaffolding protein for murein synthesis (MipA/OmpV family)